MKEQLIHILDQSVCLSRKQMKEYLSGTMLPEETHAAEVHLSSCPLCSLAMEGFSEHSEQALQAIAALNSGFLKDHFDNISPQIHLNSMAPAAAMALPKSGRKRAVVQPLWRVGSIAAAMLLLFGLIWAFERSHNREASVAKRTAMNSSSYGGEGGNGTDANSAGDNGSNTSANAGAAPIPKDSKTNADNKPSPAATAANNGLASTASNTSSKAAAAPALNAPSRQARAAVSGAVDSPAGMTSTTTAGGAAALKEPPATKTFIEYDPSANGDQAEKKEGTPANHPTTGTETIVAKNSAPNPETKSKPAIVSAKPADTKDDITRGDDSYSKGSYGAALAHYKKGMTSSDEHTRYQSMVMAAQCYAALGNKAKAEELLQRVINNAAGPDRRAARRALRRLQ